MKIKHIILAASVMGNISFLFAITWIVMNNWFMVFFCTALCVHLLKEAENLRTIYKRQGDILDDNGI